MLVSTPIMTGEAAPLACVVVEDAVLLEDAWTPGWLGGSTAGLLGVVDVVWPLTDWVLLVSVWPLVVVELVLEAEAPGVLEAEVVGPLVPSPRSSTFPQLPCHAVEVSSAMARSTLFTGGQVLFYSLANRWHHRYLARIVRGAAAIVDLNEDLFERGIWLVNGQHSSPGL